MKDKSTDEKRELKRERIRSYFLEAAKEIIIKEGYEGVSARKVADIAGYSYATIYNYFRDLNGLMREVKNAMIKDIFKTLQEKMPPTAYDMEGLKNGFRTYISYYLKNPNVFKFFYFYPMGKSEESAINKDSGPDFDKMWGEAFKGMILEGKLREEDIEVAAKTLIYLIHGLIMIYFSDNENMTEDMVYHEMDKTVEFIMKRPDHFNK